MTISVRLNDKDTELIKKYAEMNNISLSDLIRNAIMEKIEDEYDLECYYKALEEYKKNPKTYTHEELGEMMKEWEKEENENKEDDSDEEI